MLLAGGWCGRDVLTLAAKSTWERHRDSSFCSDKFVLLRMRKMELKRMRKRIQRMWMKKKVVMKMTVGMISIGKMGGLQGGEILGK